MRGRPPKEIEDGDDGDLPQEWVTRLRREVAIEVLEEFLQDFAEAGKEAIRQRAAVELRIWGDVHREAS